MQRLEKALRTGEIPEDLLKPKEGEAKKDEATPTVNGARDTPGRRNGRCRDGARGEHSSLGCVSRGEFLFGVKKYFIRVFWLCSGYFGSGVPNRQQP